MEEINYPATLEIVVTDEHIKKGKRGSECLCPIALAMYNVLDPIRTNDMSSARSKYAYVMPSMVSVFINDDNEEEESVKYVPADEDEMRRVTSFIKDFDRGDTVLGPMSFKFRRNDT